MLRCIYVAGRLNQNNRNNDKTKENGLSKWRTAANTNSIQVSHTTLKNSHLPRIFLCEVCQLYRFQKVNSFGIVYFDPCISTVYRRLLTLQMPKRIHG